MNNLITYLLSSPLIPLKEEIALNKYQNKVATITPLRGPEARKYDNKLILSAY